MNALNNILGAGGDGFNGPTDPPRPNHMRWSAESGWLARDGLIPPELLWGIATGECLRRWQNGAVTEITAHPLPDVDELNKSIPIVEWEKGLDGRPRMPWELTYKIHFVDPLTGEFYTYATPTVGGGICVGAFKQSVVTMRLMKGPTLIPVIRLGQRPMKTKFGMKTRPHIDIEGWLTPPSSTLPANPTRPAITGPADAEDTSWEDDNTEGATAEPEAPQAAPQAAAKTVPARKPGPKTTITSGRQKSKIQEDVERPRPDLQQNIDPLLNDGLNSLPFDE
jgi:hypothetical protein